ncbi:MAG: hypothetical protein WBC75_09380 [Dehalococcoidales bacterium]
MREENEDNYNEAEAAAFLGSSSGCRTMADGTLRITVDLAPLDAIGAFTAFGAPGSPVALARISNSAALEEGRPKTGKPVKGPYGEYAKKLVQSGFFRSPAVWAGIGTDEEYLEWVKHQKCAKSGDFSEYHDDGEAYNIPAHVRRVEHGSGTAIKPEYSAIPLTNIWHQKAHQMGDSVVGDELWWDKMRIHYVSQWAYETMKAKMGYDSYTDMAPHRLVDWAKQHELTQYLPMSYINAETEIHAEMDDS